MINPIIYEFTFKLFSNPITITLRWYGVLVMLGALIGAWIAEKEIRRRGENSEIIWDAMVWVLPIGILGARLWYVLNSILGGTTYYIDNPIKILYVWEGGLHIFGGFLFGVLTLYFFLKNAGKDFSLFLDALGPAALIGQAIGRVANYINQELYGQPTNLPWGIPIEATHRLLQYSDLSQYPVATTRFHPTFAYEMILNILIALALLWIARRYEDTIKPGTIFTSWMVLAGLSRTFIEFFRPDQPRIGDSFVSYTMVASFAMALVGAFLLLSRYKILDNSLAENWEDEYQISKPAKPAPARPASPTSAQIVKKAVLAKSAASARKPAPMKKSITPKKKPATKKAKIVKKTIAKKSTTKAKPKAKTSRR
jgi:phosphatidylglycerol:prolipoprotein diacylglycerol transferase